MLDTDQIKAVLALIIPFLAAEGAADTAERWSAPKAAVAKASLEETQIQFGELGNGSTVDRSNMVPGNDIPLN